MNTIRTNTINMNFAIMLFAERNSLLAFMTFLDEKSSIVEDTVVLTESAAPEIV
jgi:hypothetical protein